MRAVCWHAPRDIRVDTVPDPTIVNPQDAIIRVTSTAICGSDLHLYNGFIPTMRAGDVLGHEFMGEVVEVGRGVRSLRPGSRVVVPFPIACGACWPCRQGLTSLCDNSNPNAEMAEALYGFSGAGLFGYSHLYGGYAGGQAQFVRVPFADIGPLEVPEGFTDEEVLFLSDVFPTGYMAAENCGIQPGDVIAVWGCGPVGQFAIQSAYLLGAERVIAIDRWPARLRLAETAGKAETIDYEAIEDVVEELKQRTGGRGPMRASTRSAPRPTARPSTRATTGPSRWYASAPTASTHCARRSRRAGRAARSRSPACTAASSTRCRSARRSPRG